METWASENHYYHTSTPSRLLKTMALYEIYKLSLGLPGDIVELGVYKGTSLIKLLTFRDALEAPSSRRVVAFDAFGKFPESPENPDQDKDFIQDFSANGGDGLSLDEISQILETKKFTNYELISGDVLLTLEDWLAANPARRFSLIHLDMDVYQPTKFALHRLWERLVEGGASWLWTITGLFSALLGRLKSLKGS